MARPRTPQRVRTARPGGTDFILGRPLSADRQLEQWIVAHRVGALDPLFIGASWIGSVGAVWLAIALVLALSRRSVGVFVVVLAADLAADLLAELGKLLIPRHRPFVHQLGPPAHTHSFPSGHTATSFACATVLAVLAPRFRVPFFLLAAAVAFSRLYNGDHYPLDVLGGAVLGVLVAAVVLRSTAPRLPSVFPRRSRRERRSG